MKFTKKEIVAELRKSYAYAGLKVANDEQAWTEWKAFCDTIRRALESGNTIPIVGVGAMSRSLVEGKKGRNPKTGETFDIPPYFKVKVKPAEGFKR